MKTQVFKYLKGAWTLVIIASLGLIVTLTIQSNNDKVKETASSFFKEIVTTRAWNASHVGVYVFVDEKTPPNPYLDVPNRDIYTTDSLMLTLINPAYMTRQISELAEIKDDFLYHITSNKPIRPLNKPDSWESVALDSFENNKTFAFERTEFKKRNYYRYMAPLIVTEACMKCHAKQGYQIGDIRGGISVSIQSKPYTKELHIQLVAISIVHIIFLFIGLLGIGMSQKAITKQFKLTRLKSQQLALHKVRLTQSNSQLKELNLQKEKFLSIIAHDLKNPVGAIMGLSEILVEEIESADISHKKVMLTQLHNSAVNTYNLMENLLAWSRSQQGTIEYKPTRLKLIDEIQEAIEIVSQSADSKSIDCNVSLGMKKDRNIWADKNMISAILRNLLTNSIKFTPKGGKIKITARTESNNLLRICIADTGIGIPENKIQDLFKIEKNTSTPGTDNEKGTGLGLILVKEFVEANKGTLLIKSQEGNGTTISFTVPIFLTR